jgi:SAM-dependent methyltransferase
MVELADIASEHRVLDVACGTGAFACAAALRARKGQVIGLDPNEAMLRVAREKDTNVEWITGKAEALAFDEASFDRVGSQFGMMFFENATQALREMNRVLRPGGRLVVAVCDGIDHSPGYAVLTELLQRLFGSQVAEAFRAPFSLGDRDKLAGHATAARLDQATVRRVEGMVRFSSVSALVSAERACAWTLGGLLDEAQFRRLSAAAEESLRPFLEEDGAVAFGMPALVLTANKPS